MLGVDVAPHAKIIKICYYEPIWMGGGKLSPIWSWKQDEEIEILTSAQQ